MLNFPMVNSAVPGPLLAPALYRPWQGSTETEQGTREELSCWVSQGCIDMASPALAIQVFVSSFYPKAQSEVCCDLLPRIRVLSPGGITSRNQSCSFLNLLMS